MEDRKLLILIFSLITLKGLLFVVLVPPWQGPDEPYHFKMSYLLSNPSSDLRAQTDVDLRNSLQKYRFDEYVDYSVPEQAVLLYEWKMIFPLYYLSLNKIFFLFGKTSLVDLMYVGRLFSLLLHVGTIFLIYLIAKKIMPRTENKWFIIAVVSFAGFQPQWSFFSSVMNTDNLISFLFTGLSFCLVSLVLLGESSKTATLLTKSYWVFAILLTLGGLLTKRTGIVGLIVLTISGFFIIPKGNILKRVMIFLGISILFSFLVYVLYMYSDQIRSDIQDKILIAIHSGIFKVRYIEETSIDLVLRFFLVQFVSFWFSLGWMIYKMSLGWYAFFALISLLVLGGMIRLVYCRFKSGSFNSINIGLVSILILLFVLSQMAMVIAHGPFPHSSISSAMGRFRFMEIAAVAVLIPLGLWAISPVRRRNLVMKLFACFMIFLNMVSVFQYMIPIFYL